MAENENELDPNLKVWTGDFFLLHKKAILVSLKSPVKGLRTPLPSVNIDALVKFTTQRADKIDERTSEKQAFSLAFDFWLPFQSYQTSSHLYDQIFF